MVLFVEGKRAGVSSSTGHAGLRVLAQIYEGELNNIVVKSGLRSLTKSSIISSSYSSLSSSKSISIVGEDYCFLRSCHLCNKALRPDKDVYMYRGDQGFCSIECRNRQIMVDEMKEMEAKTKKRVVASSLDCRGCETCKLLEDLRQQRGRRLKQQQQQSILSIVA